MENKIENIRVEAKSTQTTAYFFIIDRMKCQKPQYINVSFFLSLRRCLQVYS